MAENRPRRGLRHVAFEDVQIGSADRGGVDPNDDVRRSDDRGILDGVPAALAGTVVDKSVHDAFSYLRPDSPATAPAAAHRRSGQRDFPLTIGQAKGCAIGI